MKDESAHLTPPPEAQAWPGRPLLGRSALLAAAAEPLGTALAEALAAAGASLTVLAAGSSSGGYDRDGLERRHQVPVRLASGGAREAVAAAQDAFGSLDILVQHAGFRHGAPSHLCEPELWEAGMALNLSAPFQAVRAALPGMRARGWGRIVGIASAHALAAQPGEALYTAACHALAGLTRAIALECAGTEVTCNLLCPGELATPRLRRELLRLGSHEGMSAAQAREHLLGPQGPAGPVDAFQVAAAAVFLCTRAAAEVRGAVIPLDGGWTAC